MSDPVLEGTIAGDSLSFSKIGIFLRCAYAYYLRYVKKERSVPTAAMILGRSFHAGQSYGVNRMIEASTPPGRAVRDFAVADFEKALTFEQSIEYDEKDPDSLTVKDDLAKMTGPVFDKSVSKLAPISSEEFFTLNVEGTQVRGRLDIKDKLGEGMCVTELKTGTRTPELLQSFDPQTSMYQYAQEHADQYEMFPQKPVLGLRKIFTKRHLDKARNFSVHLFEKAPDPPALIADMIAGIKSVAEAIKSASLNGFTKTADLRICSYCGHRRGCRPDIFGNEGQAEAYVKYSEVFTTKPQKEKSHD